MFFYSCTWPELITFLFWLFFFLIKKLLWNATTKDTVAKVVLDYAEFCSQGLLNNLCATQKKKSALPLLLANFFPE